MEYSLLTDTLSKDRLIHKVYKIAAPQGRVRIKWDCLIEDDNDLIVVVRSPSKSFSVASIAGVNSIPQGTDIFVYSRKDTNGHVERDRKKGANSYFVFPGKLLDTGKIGVCEQKDGKNIIFGSPRDNSTSNYVQPEGELYYQYRFPIHVAVCLCLIAIGWGIHAIVVDLPIPLLARYPRIDYKYFAIAIAIGNLIFYLIFPSGNWSKRACLHINSKSTFTNKDILRYTVSGCKEKFKIRLMDNSDDIVIPLYSGENVTFDKRDIQIKRISYINYLHQKHKKNEKD